MHPSLIVVPIAAASATAVAVGLTVGMWWGVVAYPLAGAIALLGVGSFIARRAPDLDLRDHPIT